MENLAGLNFPELDVISNFVISRVACWYHNLKGLLLK